ncbi:hypothetical protein BGZ76_007625 [Entomortierella beljakovae]|nr:hypothetical protein BGZ76_007625 [Entomortierella beljakovae]
MPQFVNANHHFKCSYQNPLNQSGSQISLENPHLKIKDITITKQSPPSRIHSYNTQTRPLPTPPVTKHIRWATYHEVLEIDNIEDLALQGYYDDYDGELGWNYRDETKEAHVSLDTNDKGESAGNKERRDTRFTHGNSCFSSPSSLLFENESETESDSVTDDSEIAEDEAIQQIAEMGNLYSSISSLPPLPSFNSQQQHQVPSSQKPQITYETLPKVDDHTYYDDTPVVSSLLLREPSPKIVEMTSPKHPLPLPLTGYYLSLAATAPFTKYHTISNNRLATLMKPVSLRVECVLKGRAPRLDRDRILAEVAKRRSINAVTA